MLTKVESNHFPSNRMTAFIKWLGMSNGMHCERIWSTMHDRAENWQWSSLWRRERGTSDQKQWLGRWPRPLPGRWLEYVNAPQTDAELETLRRCGKRGQPFGGAEWISSTAKELGLESTLRSRGRPRKHGTLPKSLNLYRGYVLPITISVTSPSKFRSQR